MKRTIEMCLLNVPIEPQRNVRIEYRKLYLTFSIDILFFDTKFDIFTHHRLHKVFTYKSVNNGMNLIGIC